MVFHGSTVAHNLSIIINSPHSSEKVNSRILDGSVSWLYPEIVSRDCADPFPPSGITRGKQVAHPFRLTGAQLRERQRRDATRRQVY